MAARPNRTREAHRNVGSSIAIGLWSLFLIKFTGCLNVELAETFANAGSFQGLRARRELPTTLHAEEQLRYWPLVRRESKVQENLQKYIKLQQKRVARVKGDGLLVVNNDQKLAYLAKLGLKTDRLEKLLTKPPWYAGRLKAGDRLQGYFQHPSYTNQQNYDLTLVMTSKEEGLLISKMGNFEGPVDIQQDPEIEFEKGPQRTMDLAAYIFCKCNRQWRDPNMPSPDPTNISRLRFNELQRFFGVVTKFQKNEDFPPKEIYEKACAEPAKGMTREEFIAFVTSEDEDFLETALDTFYTGRRLLMTGTKLRFNGDFQDESPHIWGYVDFQGDTNGLFELSPEPES